MTYIPKTDKELKHLAFDIVSDKVFYDEMIPESKGRAQIVSLVFLPLFFMKTEILQELSNDNIAMFYEYYTKGLKKGINGYPTFSSCNMLDKNDKVKLIAFINEVQEFKSNFKEENPQYE